MSPSRVIEQFEQFVMVGSEPSKPADTMPYFPYSIDVGIRPEDRDDLVELAQQNGFRPVKNGVYAGDTGGGHTWTEWVHAGAFSGAVTALSLTLRAYITRRKGNTVSLWTNGSKRAELKGDLSADDIVRILEAHLASPPEEPTPEEPSDNP
jgi:hypothetical protein